MSSDSDFVASATSKYFARELSLPSILFVRMASKVQFQIEADKVDIQILWKAITKDIFEVAREAAPDLFSEWQVLEGDGQGNIGLGSLLHFTLGPVAPHLAFKERIVELDEDNHLVSFQVLEGDILKHGFTNYVLSFKLDDIGEGNTIITYTFAYDLEKDLDVAQLSEELIKLVKYFLSSVVSYLQQKNNA